LKIASPSEERRTATDIPLGVAILLLPAGLFTRRRCEIIGERLAAELAGIDVVVAECPTDEEDAA
jgi:hypothetical protein